ncbi:MAG: GNAT family N-acetyltransferase [Rhodoferax sp.]|nr:GNAT family N-acetyltransferase [Rhodoferax sp.]
MSPWQDQQVPFKFQLSDWTLFSVSRRLQVRTADLFDEEPSSGPPALPIEELATGSQGFLIRGMPMGTVMPAFSRIDDYVCYVPLQYQHSYIDFSLSFESYQKKFSSKTRSTLHRKVRKYAEHCGGTIRWKTYRQPDEMRDFFQAARTVSKLTYQERLLDAGIPDSEDFIRQTELMAAEECIRAYVLFDGERPVAYLYCPIENDILIYSHLGYDPDYTQMSVGTVLQWLAVEQLFSETRFRYFDFTEGDSDHKRLFATGHQQCANVFFMRRNVANMALIYGQLMINFASMWLGTKLDQMGLKAKIKRLIRFST